MCVEGRAVLARPSHPQRRASEGENNRENAPRKPARRKRAWPFAVAILAAWALIFGAIGYSRWISTLPDTTKLLTTGPSRDITLLDDQHHQIAQRGLTQGAMVDVRQMPDHVA